MHHRFLSTFAVVLVAVSVSACGDDDSEFDPPPVSPIEAYRSVVGAQCLDAKENQQQLDTPQFGDEAQLATYLAEVVRIAEDLSQRLADLEPPTDLARGMRSAIEQEQRLGEIVASYQRAASGGRDFELVLTQLEEEVNGQIRRVNRAFGALEIPACQGPELDLPVGGS